MHKPVIFGLSGLEITPEERGLFLATQPFGFILFKRNCASREQIIALTSSLKALFPKRRVEIMIDQEGGRVSRIRPPIATREYPAPAYFANAYDKEGATDARQALHDNYQTLMSELISFGVTMTCAPLADLLFDGADNVIGDRSFGANPEVVTELCMAVLEALRNAGSEGIIKHIPGHGRAVCDSHKELPTVYTPLEELETTDFLPFKLLAPHARFAMTAHVRFMALDKEQPVTLSKPAIDYIRNEIGFKGLLMTDDMSMKALKGDIGSLSKQALEAGCDLILHCNGDMYEMNRIAEVL